MGKWGGKCERKGRDVLIEESKTLSEDNIE